MPLMRHPDRSDYTELVTQAAFGAIKAPAIEPSDTIEHVGALTPDIISDTLWFRGQAQAEWYPLPALLRGDYNHRSQMQPNELFFNSEFKRRAAVLTPSHFGDVAIYSMAQHYGLLTRLLDWTLNPLVALYFAANSSPETDGALFTLDPVYPVKFSPTALGPIAESDELLTEEISRSFGTVSTSEPIIEGFPIPVLPTHRFDRLVRQNGTFTFHPHKVSNFPDGRLKKYIIPAAEKRQMLDDLARYGISEHTLYGDLGSLANELARHWRLTATEPDAWQWPPTPGS